MLSVPVRSFVRSCENSSRNSSVVGGSGSGVSHKTHETWERAVRI